jgi:hypothetical protein
MVYCHLENVRVDLAEPIAECDKHFTLLGCDTGAGAHYGFMRCMCVCDDSEDFGR